MNKKGAELSLNTIIIVIIAILVLITVLFIFNSAMRDFATDLFTKLKNALNLWDSAQLS